MQYPIRDTIFTIFVFVLAANWIGMLPHITTFFGFVIALIHQLFTGDAGQWVLDGITKTTFIPNQQTFYYFLFKIPQFEEPTRSINTDLALGLLVFIIVHVNSVKKHGLLEYFRSYMGDIVPSKGWWILLFPINPFFYLNLRSIICAEICPLHFSGTMSSIAKPNFFDFPGFKGDESLNE